MTALLTALSTALSTVHCNDHWALQCPLGPAVSTSLPAVPGGPSLCLQPALPLLVSGEDGLPPLLLNLLDVSSPLLHLRQEDQDKAPGQDQGPDRDRRGSQNRLRSLMVKTIVGLL